MLLPDMQNYSSFNGKRVLLRVDFNVPVEEDSDLVLSDFKIKKTMPTIKFLKEEGAKIILISHIGRDKEESLLPIYKYLKEKMAIDFWESLSDAQEKSKKMKEGGVALLENLRQWDGEKENNFQFAENLSSLADIYVNDAFAVSHREHASIVGVPKNLPSFSGILFKREHFNLRDALSPSSPSLFILGGAKFKTKLPLVEKISKIYDKVFVGGALANDFFKAKGFNVGDSLVSNEDLITQEMLENKNIILPSDLIIEDKSGNKKIKKSENIKDEEIVMDIGPDSSEKLSNCIRESSFILWNGPLGYFEEGYDKYTKKVGTEIKESQSFSIVGGGDTIASLKDIEIEEFFNFVSTAGGAMIEFLLNETLPGIEALKKSNR